MFGCRHTSLVEVAAPGGMALVRVRHRLLVTTYCLPSVNFDVTLDGAMSSSLSPAIGGGVQILADIVQGDE